MVVMLNKFGSMSIIALLAMLTSCSMTGKTKTPDQDIANPSPYPSATAPLKNSNDTGSFVSPTAPPTQSPDSDFKPKSSEPRNSGTSVKYEPLERYNQMAGGDFATSVMLFSSTPVGEDEIESVSNRIAAKIKTLSKSNLEVIVVLEPISASQGKLNFSDIALGKYNNDFVGLMTALKSKGVTNANIGNWIIWPEPNLPDKYWNKPRFESANFGDMFNNFAAPLKAAYPNAKMTILMDTKSYDPSDYDYANGKAVSWSPYLNRVDKSLVTTIGIQGFTWYAKDGSDKLIDPKQYLPTTLVVEAAQQLGIKSLLVNTGQAKAYKSTNGGVVQISDSQRRRINQEVAAQILKLKNYGYETTANFFVEDKIDTPEGIDFSYPTDDAAMFRLLINDLNYAKVKIGMFVPN
jgi:hypothetical protein